MRRTPAFGTRGFVLRPNPNNPHFNFLFGTIIALLHKKKCGDKLIKTTYQELQMNTYSFTPAQ